MAGWAETFRSLGQSILTVWRAEAAAVDADLRRTGRQAGIAIGLLAAAALIAFWAVGVLIAAAVALLAVWLPVWGAALVVFALFGGVAGGLVWSGVRRLREIENPVVGVRRRVSDHLDWWQNTLLAPPDAGPAGELEDTGFYDPYREEDP